MAACRIGFYDSPGWRISCRDRFSEYALAKPESWDFFRPMLAENGGWALFVSTVRGRNHFYQIGEYAKGNLIGISSIRARMKPAYSRPKPLSANDWADFELGRRPWRREVPPRSISTTRTSPGSCPSSRAPRSTSAASTRPHEAGAPMVWVSTWPARVRLLRDRHA